jgi:DNA-binding CsgD family transcriptional regulator/tetratricopeptide (TPR) repeat protein
MIKIDHPMPIGTPLPGPLRFSPAFAFAGRAQERATLRALVPRSTGEGRRAAFVAGEPGSGKSRLVRELARDVADEGAIVLYGDCDGVIGVPYGPFEAALEQLVRHVEPEILRASLGSGGGELTRLLPDLPARLGDLPTPAAADADTERHRLHTAVTDLLVGISSETPLVLVLEDLHWADVSTLQLMRHLVRSGAEARMLLVATFRDSETDVQAELAEALVDVYRTEGVVRIRLGGLSRQEIGEFVRLATGVDATAGLAGAIEHLTGGNAFLVTELWRELVGSGAVEVGPSAARLMRPATELGVPTTVREVVDQRLARLPAATIEVLELAAVMGADFELETVRRAATGGEEGLVEALDEAVRSGLLVEGPGRGLSYRFEHELVRRAVDDRLSAARTAELHLRVAEALEHGHTGRDSRAVLAALAHHFAAAAPVGGIERAVSYNLLAAESGIAALAYGEAQERLETALELGVRDPHERGAVMLQLGDTCHRAGHADAALDAFSRTAELARSLGDAPLLARAAIGLEDACWRPAIHDAGAIELLEEAVAALPADDSELRARALGGLARALDFRGESGRAAVARDEAIAMSRHRGDRQTLGTILAMSYWARGSSTNEQVNRMLHEAREIGHELADDLITGDAVSWLVPSYVVLCDHHSARDALAEVLTIARRLSQPFLFHVAEHYASVLALCDGRLAEAESAAVRSQEWGRLLTGRDASGTYGIQMFGIRREQGRLPELAPVVRLLQSQSHDGAWRPGLAVLLAELGMESEARRELGEILVDGIGAFRPSLWLGSLVYLADACAALQDEACAEVIYPELAVYAGSNVMIGHLVACYGAMDRFLGATAAVLGDWDRAEEHFHDAIALNTRLGARTWLAHTAYAYARMLLARGTGDDRSHARAQLGVAIGLAQTIGLPTLLRRATELGTGAEPTAPSLPDGLSAREVEILVQLARGRSNREIGSVLHISEHTAANHVRSILRKTGCANRTEAAGYALRRGLVPTEVSP